MAAGDRVLGMIGLARRAGQALAGTFLAEKSVRAGAAQLIVVALDAADNAKKKMKNTCSYYGVEYIEYGTKASLAASIGKENIAVVCINGESFAKGIIDKYRQQCRTEGD